jgi:predicted ATPase
MKLKSVEFVDCPIFGSVLFDFTDEHGRAVDTILIAGENGSGKTMLLETILNHRIPITDAATQQHLIFRYELIRAEGALIVGPTISAELDDVETFVVNIKNQSNGSQTGQSVTVTIEGEKSFFGSGGIFNAHRSVFYLPAEINFKSSPITTVTNQDIDAGVTVDYNRNDSLATLLSQVLVNIEALDAIDFAKWAKRTHRDQVDYSKVDRRMRRFEWAFAFMFPNKKFKEIKNDSNGKKILFEENGRVMDINQLSSGEKQIVFRGGYVLQNLQNLQNSIFLMDEPEISLHPNWQLKIVDFYKKIFSDGEGQQTAQIFVTTHSPFILHNYLRKNDRVIIIKRDGKGAVLANKKDSFFGWTNEKIVEAAFNIKLAPIEQGTIFVEGETDELYIKRAISTYFNGDFPFEIKWVGRVDESGNVQFTGDKALNHIYGFLLSNPSFIKAPTILLYDSDTRKPLNRQGDLIVECLPLVEGRKYNKGIENLLRLPKDFDYNSFYSKTNKTGDYGAESIIAQLDKKKLCTQLCGGDYEEAAVLSEIYEFLVSLEKKYG